MTATNGASGTPPPLSPDAAPGEAVCLPSAPPALPLQYYTPERPSGPVGLGGWLILPAIGLVCRPISLLADIVRRLTMAHGISPYVQIGEILEVLADAAYAALLIYAGVAFFRKKRSTPVLMTTVYAADIAFNVLRKLVHAGLWNTSVPQSIVQGVIPAGIGAAIWISYFRISKRVKATFIY